MTMTETTTTAQVRIPHTDEMLNGLFAVALHTSKDDATPIITTVRVDGRTFIATDRYTVGEFTHDGQAEATDSFIIIPRSAADWLVKQTLKSLGIKGTMVEPVFETTFTDESITVRWKNESDPDAGAIVAVHRFGKIAGIYPPVARLIPARDEPAKTPEGAAVVHLNPAFMEKFVRGAKRVLGANEPLTFTLQTTTNPSKPGPMLVEFGAFRGLIQPILTPR